MLNVVSGFKPSLNPFGTGQGLSTVNLLDSRSLSSLNPFGTGQGLSTSWERAVQVSSLVLIPLEQGKVFRLRGWFSALMDKAWEDRFPIFSLTRKVGYEFD